MKIWVWSAYALIVWLQATPSSAALCPPDTVRSSRPSFNFETSDSSLSRTDSDPYGLAVERVSYSLGRGELLVHSRSILPQWVSLAAHDDYTVVGLANGTPVSLTLVVVLNGTGCCESVSAMPAFSASVSGAAGATRSATGALFWHRTLMLPLIVTSGQPFDLRFWLKAQNGTGSRATATATIRFGGIPAGAKIVSCQGYDSSVPTAPTLTWGFVKATYR